MSNPPNVVDVVVNTVPTEQIAVYDVTPGPTQVNVTEPSLAPPPVLSGVGPPAETTGSTGAYYVDTATGVLYGPRSAAPVSRPPAQFVVPASLYPNAGNPGSNYEIGLEVEVNTPGVITGVRFYRHVGDTATTRKVNLWTGTGGGVLLGSQVITVTMGWGSYPLTTPINVTPGRYVVSYNSPTGTNINYVAPGAVPTLLVTTANVAPVIGRTSAANSMDIFPPNFTDAAWMVDVLFTPKNLWPVAGLDPGGRPAQMDAYTTPGDYTWTKPAGAKMVRLVMVNPGSGGGSGCRSLNTVNRSGGGGGGGGPRLETVFAAADLPPTVPIHVEVGGAGGAAVTTDSTNGNVGASSGACRFGPNNAQYTTWVGVGAGAGGNGGVVNAGAAGGGGPLGAVIGGAGTNGGAGGGGGWSADFTGAATSAGAGGGVSAANAATNGGGAFVSPLTVGYAVTAGGAGGVVGANGGTSTYLPTGPEPWPAGSGGSGGGGGSAGVGGNGGNGVRGGGGGGGGASSNGFASGAGGKGGDGFVQVITYF